MPYNELCRLTAHSASQILYGEQKFCMRLFDMDAATHKMQVGARLRMAIESLGMKQAQIGREFNVSPSKLGNWLRGDDYPAEFFVHEFCDRYSITADWIYRGRVSASMDKALADGLWTASKALLAE